jgi:hypothetical protein
MKTAALVVLIVVLAVVAAAGGFLYGTSRFTGQFSLSDLSRIGAASSGPGQFLVRGQFDPSQLSPEQIQSMQQARGTPGAQRGGFGQGQGTQGGQGGTVQGGQGGAFGGGTFGTIESIEGNVVTVKMQNGSTVRAKTTETTLIEKLMGVTVQDLKVGEQVTVSGSQNADGTTTARSIRVMSAPR